MADAWEKSIINVHTTTHEVEEPRLPMVATTGKSPVARQVPPSAVARGMGTSYKTYYQCQRHLQKTFSTDVASPEVEAQAEAVNSPRNPPTDVASPEVEAQAETPTQSRMEPYSSAG
jgi:hypothetical protein